MTGLNLTSSATWPARLEWDEDEAAFEDKVRKVATTPKPEDADDS